MNIDPGAFTVIYQTGSSIAEVLDARCIVTTSPEMDAREMCRFIISIGPRKVCAIYQDGKPVSAGVLASIISETTQG